MRETMKDKIIGLLETGKKPIEIQKETGFKISTIRAITSLHRRAKKAKETPKVRVPIAVIEEAPKPPEAPAEQFPSPEEAFAMTLEDAKAIYVAPAEVLNIILNTPNIPEGRVTLQGTRLYNFFRKYNIQLPWAELVLLMTGYVADYAKIVREYWMRKREKIKAKAAEKEAKPSVPELTPEAEGKPELLTPEEAAKLKI